MIEKMKGSMVAITTPMQEDGSLDFESLEALIEFHIKNETDVIVSVGTTGESDTLNFEEHSNVIKTTIEIGPSKIFLKNKINCLNIKSL